MKSAAGLSRFASQPRDFGRQYRVDAAIDHFTGRVIDKQIEVVNE